MSELPNPTWLTLTETIAWLAEQGITEADAKSNLPRAFRNGQIQTRGRGRKYTGHNTHTTLNGITWDQATIYWEDSSFEIPASDGRTVIPITDVDVSRDDLSRWISEDEGDSSNIVPVKRTGGRKPKYDWDAFHAEIAVRADLDGLPDIQADLEKDMASWCLETWGERPTESAIRSKISRIYQHTRKPQGQ